MAEAEALGARKRPNPSLDVEFRGYPLFASDLPPFLDNQELTIAVDQEFEPGDRRRWRREVAQLGVQASAAESLDVLRRLRLDVQRAYVHVVLAQADGDAARATLTTSTGSSRSTAPATSRANCRASNSGACRSSATGSPTMRWWPTSRSGTPGAACSPCSTCARSTSRSRRWTRCRRTAGCRPSRRPRRPEGRRERADLTALRLGEQRAEADARLQHALRIPPFSLGAGWQRDFGTNAIVVRATVPLALWNRNEGGRSRAAAERTLAASRTSAASAAAELEVQLARNAVESSRARVAVIASEYVKNAREARDIVLAAYRAGAATLIDYLDAQRAFRDAQRAEHRARFDYRVSVFELEAAVGTEPSRRPIGDWACTSAQRSDARVSRSRSPPAADPDPAGRRHPKPRRPARPAPRPATARSR